MQGDCELAGKMGWLYIGTLKSAPDIARDQLAT